MTGTAAPLPDSAATNRGALRGIRVLDLSTMILGPLMGQYLGDMGADVIKVEPPAGDLTRFIGPRRSPDMAAFFLNSNRNKRSVVLDIKHPAGRAALEQLVRGADVVIHSIRSAAARRLGLDYARLSELKPDIILCHVKGYSDAGPYAGLAAYDDVAQATSGLAALQQVVAGEPRYMPTIIGDKISSLHAAWAVAIALVHRERTGRGQEVSVPMMETMVAFNTVEHLWGAAFEPPLGAMGYVPVSQAARRPFRCKDGRYLCVLPYNDGHWKRFCEEVGDPALTSDPRFINHAARQSDQQLFWSEVGRRVAERTADEWVEALTRADVPFGRVNTLEDLLTDPHLLATGFWEVAEHPTEGALRHAVVPTEFSDSPGSVRLLPRHLGEDTAAVLAEAGVSAADIDRLSELGVTVPRPPQGTT